MAAPAPDAADYARDTARLLRLCASLAALRQRHDRLAALFLSTHGSLNGAVDSGRILARLERIDRLLGRVEQRFAVVAATIAAFAEKCGDGS